MVKDLFPDLVEESMLGDGWMDNKRHGQGTWTLSDGSKFLEFGNIIKDGILFVEEGNKIEKLVNGKLEDNDEPLTLINAQSKGGFSKTRITNPNFIRNYPQNRKLILPSIQN